MNSSMIAWATMIRSNGVPMESLGSLSTCKIAVSLTDSVSMRWSRSGVGCQGKAALGQKSSQKSPSNRGVSGILGREEAPAPYQGTGHAFDRRSDELGVYPGS